MLTYQESFTTRFPSLNLRGRSVEYFETVGNNDLVILREGDSVGYALETNLQLTDETVFQVYQPFGIYLKLMGLGIVEEYPNLMLTLQRLMSTLPSAVEVMVDKARELEENPEEFYAWLVSDSTENLIEIANFFMTLHAKTERLPNVDTKMEASMSMFKSDIVEKLLTETKAMTEPMFDSWLSLQSDEDLSILYVLGEFGLTVNDELEEREME